VVERCDGTAGLGELLGGHRAGPPAVHPAVEGGDQYRRIDIGRLGQAQHHADSIESAGVGCAGEV
jgi:hypothetical protein